MIWTVSTGRGPVVVREQIEPEDEPGLLRLFDQSADYFEAATGAPPGPGDVQSLFYTLPEAATFDDKRLFTVREGDEIVGVIDAVLRHPSPRACSVGLFLIAPRHRRQGVGTAVAGVLLDELRSIGVEEVIAGLADGWDDGRRFAEALGFTVSDPRRVSSGNRRIASSEPPVRRAVLEL